MDVSLMNISYDYYRIFYYVAKCGSFTGAANALLNNQPNITRAIKALEYELGCTLFIRSDKGVTLTPEGEKLYQHIAVAFQQIEAGEAEISLDKMLMYGKEASNRKQEIDRQHYTIPNQRPKDKHCGKI